MRYRVTVQTVIVLPANDFQDAADKAVAVIRDNTSLEDDVTVSTIDTKRVEPT